MKQMNGKDRYCLIKNRLAPKKRELLIRDVPRKKMIVQIRHPGKGSVGEYIINNFWFLPPGPFESWWPYMEGQGQVQFCPWPLFTYSSSLAYLCHLLFVPLIWHLEYFSFLVTSLNSRCPLCWLTIWQLLIGCCLYRTWSSVFFAWMSWLSLSNRNEEQL